MTLCRHLDHSTDRFFQVTGKEQIAHCQAFLHEHAERKKALGAFLKKVKAGDRFLSTGNYITGVTFKGDPPVGWRSDKQLRCEGVQYYCPDKRTPAGKALAKEMGALRSQGDLHSLSRTLGFQTFITTAEGMFRACIHLRLLQNDSFLIKTHPAMLGGKKTLPGLIPLKASQYHALLEKDDEKRKAS